MGFLSDFLSGRRKKYITSPLAGKVMFIGKGTVQIENIILCGMDGTDLCLGQVIKKNQVVGYKYKTK